MNSILLIAILVVCSYFTAIISAVVGMAGGIVLLSVMTFFLPLKIIIPVHGLVQLISNSVRCWLLRKHIHWKIFWWFCLGLPIGMFISVVLIKEIQSDTIPLLLIAAIIFYAIFKPKNLPHLHIPFWAFSLIGFGVGFLGPLVGATGPFMAPFFLRDDLDKEGIVASKSAVQTMGHLVKIPAFLYLGFDYLSMAPMIIFMSIGVIIGTFTGVKLLSKINQSIFNKIFKTALFFAGLRVVYKALAPYFEG